MTVWRQRIVKKNSDLDILINIQGDDDMLLIIYCIVGFWAVNKVIYEGKVVIYSDGMQLFIKKIVYAFFLGWALIPIAIIKCLLGR